MICDRPCARRETDANLDAAGRRFAAGLRLRASAAQCGSPDNSPITASVTAMQHPPAVVISHRSR